MSTQAMSDTARLSPVGPTYLLRNKRVHPAKPVGGYVLYDVDGHPELTVERIEHAIPEYCGGRRVNNAYLRQDGKSIATCLVLEAREEA